MLGRVASYQQGNTFLAGLLNYYVLIGHKRGEQPFKDGADCAPVSPSATLAESWSAPVPRLHLSQLSSSATVQPGTVQLSGTAPRLQVKKLQLKMRKTLRASVETRVWYNRVLNPKMWIICPILPFSALYPPLLMAT